MTLSANLPAEVAESRRDAAESAAESRYDELAPGIIDGLVDDMMSGRTIQGSFSNGMMLDEILSSKSFWQDYTDLALCIYGNEDQRHDSINRITKEVKLWFEESPLGQAIVADRVAESERQAKEEFAWAEECREEAERQLENES